MFASRVLPGAPLVRATRWRTSALIRLDLPTFERPTSATSRRPSLGRSAALAALVTKLASILKGQVGRVAWRARWVTRLPGPTRPTCRARPSMSDGVVDDGAV